MIRILKSIYSILTGDATIQGLVGDKIFPDVVSDKDNANGNIDYPLIVMRRREINTEYTKCKDCKTDEAVVEITCYSNSYFQAVDIADAVRNALEYFKGTVDNIKLSSAKLSGITEDFVENVYYQLLVFNIK